MLQKTETLPTDVPTYASLNLPGKLTPTSWELPDDMSFEQWKACGIVLIRIGGALQWWIGDWWAKGEHAYGDRKKALREGLFEGEYTFSTLATYGWVSKHVQTSTRVEVLTHRHHLEVAHFQTPEQKKWLARAVKEQWSANELKAKIARSAAIEQTKIADLEAAKLGKFVVLYADPPWRYEHPPMGGSNRSIENHYPTMALEEIMALTVSDLAYKNSVLFLWATSPKLPECLDVIMAWGFTYRTAAVWVKDKIGMGYHFRERHESLLVAKRGELSPPPPDQRPDSVIEAPRGDHSEKPAAVRDLIDSMYPDVRKIELFARERPKRKGWAYWGNHNGGEA